MKQTHNTPIFFGYQFAASSCIRAPLFFEFPFDKIILTLFLFCFFFGCCLASSMFTAPCTLVPMQVCKENHFNNGKIRVKNK